MVARGGCCETVSHVAPTGDVLAGVVACDMGSAVCVFASAICDNKGAGIGAAPYFTTQMGV